MKNTTKMITKMIPITEALNQKIRTLYNQALEDGFEGIEAEYCAKLLEKGYESVKKEGRQVIK